MVSEQEKQIILWSKANGKTREETEAALGRFRSGQWQNIPKEAPREAIKEVPTEQPGIVQRTGEALGQRVRNVREAYARQDAGQQNPIRTGLQIAGNVAGAITDIPAEVVQSGLQATGLDKPIGKAVGAVASTKPVQAIVDYYKSLSPAAQADLDAIVNIGSLIPVGGGAKLASETAVEAGSKGIRLAGELAEGIGESGKALTQGIKESRVAGLVGGITDELSSIPSRIGTNLEQKQLARTEIKKLPTQTAQKAVVDGIDIADVQRLNKVIPVEKSQARELFDAVKKFATDKTSTNPIEVVGRPITQKLKQLEATKTSIGKKLGAVAENLGVVTKQEVTTPVFDALKRVQGLDGLTVDKNGLLNFKNTVLTTSETAADRKAIQSIYSQATKWGNGKSKHLLRQELFETLGGKKKSLTNITATQEKAFEAIRKGLSDVLEGKNADYKTLSNEYRKVIQPLSDMRRLMKNIPGAEEDILDMSSGLLARRLTSNAASNPQIRNLLRSLDKATSIAGKTTVNVENLQDLYNILNRYYDIAGETGFQGQVKAGVEGAQGIGQEVMGRLKSLAGETPAVRQKALEDLIKELIGS